MTLASDGLNYGSQVETVTHLFRHYVLLSRSNEDLFKRKPWALSK